MEEAKERLSYYEVVRFWMPYMRKRGSLHSGMRVDRGFALLAWIINHALGGNADDGRVHAVSADPKIATIQDVMDILSREKQVGDVTAHAQLRPVWAR